MKNLKIPPGEVKKITDQTTPTERQRLFDSLLFTDDIAAAKFAKDFDVLLETETRIFQFCKALDGYKYSWSNCS